MNSFLGSLTKYGIIFFNFICLVFGLLCIIFGALARSSSNYDKIVSVGQGPANMSIGIGVVVFVICFLGCCGAIKESHCMLTTFGSIVLILVIIEFTIGGLAYKYRDQLEDISVEGFTNQIAKYDTDEDIKQSIDDLQTNLKCCGASNPADWKGHIPESCFDPKVPTSIYQKGCVEAIKETLAPAMQVLAITVIVFAFIQVLGVFGSCCVASCIKRARYEQV